MIDIESMGNCHDGAIVSIAAVEFDIHTGETGLEFYEKIDLQSAINIGLKINADTIMWWMQQEESARQMIYIDKGINISEAIFKFTKFIELLNPSELQIWGNSPRFDLTLIESAYKALGKNISWKFRNERCVRTLVSFCPEIKDNMYFEGVKHNPIHDCLHQIKYCVEIMKKIKVDKS